MRFAAHERFATARLMFKAMLGSLLLGFAHHAAASPAQIIPGNVQAPFPSASTGFQVNLREQQRITGSATVTIVNAELLMDGVATQRFPIGVSGTCVNVGEGANFPNARFALRVTIQNGEGSAVGTFPLTNTPAPQIQDRSCSYLNTAPTNVDFEYDIQAFDPELGSRVLLTGFATDAERDELSYEWIVDENRYQGQQITVNVSQGNTLVNLRVRDRGQLSTVIERLINIPPGGGRPNVELGPTIRLTDTGTPGSELVTITPTITNGDPVSYQWFVDNNEIPVSRDEVFSETLDVGEHSVSVSVMMTDEQFYDDDVAVIITRPANRPPIANAGSDRTLRDDDGIVGEIVTLDGNGTTDPDGDTLTYEWRLGTQVIGDSRTEENVRLPNGRNQNVVLTVRDLGGLTATDTVVFNVLVRPIANAGADRSVASRNVQLDGRASSDPDGQIVSYVWFVNETEIGRGAQFNAELQEGENSVTLQVTDNENQQHATTVQITVTLPDPEQPQPPVINAGQPQTIRDTDNAPGDYVTLSGTATDPEEGPLTYRWALQDGSEGGRTLGTTLEIERAHIPTDGASTVTLEVTDNQRLTSRADVVITILAPPRPPTANAGEDRSVPNDDGIPGELITLTGTGTDPDGDALTYLWMLGETELGRTATLQTRLPDGVSVVTLIVTDTANLRATDTVQITVAAATTPVVNPGISQTIEDSDVQVGEMVTLAGSASGNISRYEWFLGNTSLGTGSSIRVRLPDGVNLVTLRATNAANLSGSATVRISVATGVRTVLANVPGLTENEKRLAQSLDTACNNILGPLTPVQTPTTPGETPLLTKAGRPPTEAETSDFAQKCRGLLISRNNAQLKDAMGALVGDDFAAARTQTLLFANTQYASVMDRLIALRGGARGLSLAGLNIMVDGEVIPLASLQGLAKQLFGGGASSDADGGLWGDKWGLWARGNYSFGSKENDSLSPSFDADQYALLAGLDYRVTETAVVGGALAYGNSSVDFSGNDGSLDTESWALSLYGSLYAKRNFYFDAIVNVADAGYTAERNIAYVDGYGLVNADADGDTGGLTLSGGMSGGYDFLIGGLTISPTLGAFYIDAQIDDFTESGAGGLNLIYDEQQFKSLTGTLGVRMTFAWNLPFGVVLPHFRADFVREFEDDVDVFGIRFAADPNAPSAPPILIETENSDTSYWRLAAGVSAQFKHGISGYVEYQRLESFQFISFQDVSLGLRFQAAF